MPPNTRQVVPPSARAPIAILVNQNYLASKADTSVTVQVAGVTVTLPQNPSVGLTSIEFIAAPGAAFNLSGGAFSPLTPADPLAVPAAISFFATYTATGWVFSGSATAPASVLLDFALFYANMPGDNAATVPVWTDPSSAAVAFPHAGPAKAGGAITGPTGGNNDTFTIGTAGIYAVDAQLTSAEPAQIALELGGVPLDGTLGFPNTVVGRAAGTAESVISTIITATAGQTIRVINYKSAAALTLTPTEGGTEPNTATLRIMRIG